MVRHVNLVMDLPSCRVSAISSDEYICIACHITNKMAEFSSCIQVVYLPMGTLSLRHSITIFMLEASHQKMLLQSICQKLTLNRSIIIFTYVCKDNRYLIKVDLLVKGKYISYICPFFLVPSFVIRPGTLCMQNGLQKLYNFFYISEYATNITLTHF